jgi:hypothetical protein
MSILEHFRYQNDIFQSDIFFSDIGITDVDVGCRILLTLRSMSVPTYAYDNEQAISLVGLCSMRSLAVPNQKPITEIAFT